MKIGASFVALEFVSCAGFSRAHKTTFFDKNYLSKVGLVLMPMNEKLLVLDTKNFSHYEIKIPNKKPHSVFVHPKNKQFAWIIDQASDCLSIVDLYSNCFVQAAKPAHAYEFSGHGCFNQAGDLLYTTQYPLSHEGASMVVAYRPHSLDIQHKFSSYGARSHNLALLENESVMMVGHQGLHGKVGDPLTGSCMNFISIKGEKLILGHEPDNPYLFMNHFDLRKDESVVVSTQSIYYFSDSSNPDQPQRHSLITPLGFGSLRDKKWNYVFDDSIKMRMHHNHTVAVDRVRDRSVVAHQLGYLISIWDNKTQSVIKFFDLGEDEPRGIGIFEDIYVVNTMKNRVLFISADSLEIVHRWESPNIAGEGALHLAISTLS